MSTETLLAAALAAALPLALWLRRGALRAAESPDAQAHRALAAAHGYGPSGDVRRHFALDFSFTHLNHGSFGCAPLAVLRAARAQALYMEAYPDRFMRRRDEGQRLLTAAADACAAALLRAPAGSCAFVENATAGVNAVLRSLRLQAGDVIVITDHTYNACKNAVLDVAQRSGAAVVTHSVPLPLSRGGGGAGSFADGLVEAWEATLARVAPGKLAFCLIDHMCVSLLSSPSRAPSPAQARLIDHTCANLLSSRTPLTRAPAPPLPAARAPRPSSCPWRASPRPRGRAARSS